MSERGFILQPTYRTEGGRPVVQLFGRLESGGTFLVRDDREPAGFFIDAKHRQLAMRLGLPKAPRDTEYRSLGGRRLAWIAVPQPADARRLGKRLEEGGIATHEADIGYARMYLIRRGLRGAIDIEGPSLEQPGVGRVFDNPTLKPARWAPELRLLSFDIETDPKMERLLSIGLWGCGAAEVLLLSPPGWSTPPEATGFPDEATLLDAFVDRVRQLDPDVLTGWNVVDFDLAVLDRLARRHRRRLELGRGPGSLVLRETRGAWGRLEATIPGRQVLDGIQLLRGAFLRMESWGLNAVAQQVLGEGKTMHGQGRAEDILDAFHHDRPKLVQYNLVDARLVIDILQRLRLVNLAVERSLLTGLPIDRVAGSIAALDFLYTHQLHRRGVAAPSVRQRGRGEDEVNLGGHVLEPEPGLYHNVLVFDFKSLYPSVIRTFQIDPAGYLPHPQADDDPILAPNAAAFRRQRGILSELLDELFDRRAAAQSAGDSIASQAIKTLMNSFYGVLGTSACRFYRPQLAGAVTAFGRELLKWSKKRFEDYGQAVLYGDTDSLFVLAQTTDRDIARQLGTDLTARLNSDLAAYLEQRWRVESRFELEYEKLYRRLLLMPTRHGGGGARKRYAGLVDHGDEKPPIVELVGMEAVRSDWTELARRSQRELYQRLFHDRPVEEFLCRTVAELRAGEHDPLLIYRRKLRKPLAAYTATTPPHVAAARKMTTPPGRRVAYVMTHAGPEPATERRATIDHEHYVQKQLRPIAEPVLAVLGIDFDRAIGDASQLDLFEDSDHR